jgi:hypothetical protein
MVEVYISRAAICILQDCAFNSKKKSHKGALHKFDKFEGREYVQDCVKLLLQRVIGCNLFLKIPLTVYTESEDTSTWAYH